MAVLGDFAGVRENNFNLLRCIAALMVIYAHSWGLSTQGEADDPLKIFLGGSVGMLAVNAFFIISGFLVMQSWGRQRSLLNFCRARVFRVIPGLFGVLLFTVLMAGFFWSTLDAEAFFRSGDTWKYFYKNLLMIKTEYDLPGVFASNPYPDAVNGSLWTLRYEMKMYLALAVLGLLGYLGGKRLRLFAGVFVLWYLGNTLAGLWMLEAPVSDEMLRLSLCFFLGGLATCYGARLPLHGGLLLLLGALMLLSRGGLMYDLFAALFLSYAVFYIAYIPRGWILKYNRVGDYSYGLYLYAFPIQQVIFLKWPQLGPLWVFGLASLLTLVCAIISWHLLEKPLLDYCKRLNSAVTMRPVTAMAKG